MSTVTHDARKPAKITTFENFVSKLKSEASKEVVSNQEINQAIGQAVLSWLPFRDEKILIDFFAGLEPCPLSLSRGRSSAICSVPPPSRRSARLHGKPPTSRTRPALRK